jgi:RNA polymerase sigma factor (sigma-70 family)
MATASLDSVLHHLRRLAGTPRSGEPTDAQLLQRFAQKRDEAAFALLVQRHGPMVLGVCRRVLGNRQDAEDAFQAAFLVLARKAAAMAWRDSVSAWLYTVAYRLALRARAHAARRRFHERQVASMVPVETPGEPTGQDWQPLLDEELSRLPEKYRAPLVLCYLQDRSNAEAARELGWPVGSMSTRLARGRELLRRRLARRGVTLTIGGLGTALAAEVRAALPGPLGETTVRAAMAFTAGTASGPAVVLAKEMLQNLFVTKLKVAVAMVMLLGVVAGAGLLAQEMLLGRPVEDTPPAAEAAEPKAARVDRYGDPLPDGAVARLGTVRWRHLSLSSGLAFSPDGKILASVCWDTLALWDTSTGKILRRLPTAPLNRYGGPEFTPDGKTLAVRDESGAVSFWEVATGKRVRTLPLPPEAAGKSGELFMYLSPDGRLVAEMGDRGQMVLLDAATGKVLHQFDALPGHAIFPIAFSPDSKLFAVYTFPSLAQFWDVTTGQIIRSFEAPKDIGPRAGTFSPDGKTLALGSPGHIVLWDVATAKEVGQLDVPKMRAVWSLGFTPDGKMLVSGSDDGKIRVWDLESRKERLTLENSVVLGGTGMALSRDGKTVARGSYFGTIHLWDVGTGKELFTEFQGHDAPVRCLAFTPDGRTLFTGDYRAGVRLWDTASWKQVRERKPTNDHNFVSALAPDGKRFVTEDNDYRTMHVWDCDTGAEVFKMKRPVEGFIQGFAFSRDGKTLGSFSWNMPNDPNAKRSASLSVWDAVSGKQLRQIPLPGINLDDLLFGSPQSLALTPDGRTAVVGDGEGGIRQYDLEEGKQILYLSGHKNYAGALVTSADGKTLLSGSLDQSVRVWDLVAGQEVAVLQGGKRAVAVVAFAPNGRLAASAGGAPRRTDRGVPVYPYDDVTDPLKIRLWDLATGREVAHFEGHQADVTSLAFAPDGTHLVSGQRDGTVLVWDVTSVPHLPALEVPPGGLKALWDDLAGSDAARAHRAAWTFAGQPERAVSFLQEHAQPVPALDAQQVRRWIADLDSDQFAVRAAAVKELEKLGEQAGPALREALAERSSAELRKQAEKLLGSLHRVTSPEVVQRLRAVQVLERIGSPEARKVLERLAGGALAARETREAQAALERLARRS